MMVTGGTRGGRCADSRPLLAEVLPLDIGSVVGDFQPPWPGDIPVGEAEDKEDVY